MYTPTIDPHFPLSILHGEYSQVGFPNVVAYKRMLTTRTSPKFNNHIDFYEQVFHVTEVPPNLWLSGNKHIRYIKGK